MLKVELVSVWTGIIDVPLVAIPVIPVGCVAFQEKELPEANPGAIEETKFIKLVVVPEQIVWFAAENVRTGIGFTVIVYVEPDPEQAPEVVATFTV